MFYIMVEVVAGVVLWTLTLYRVHTNVLVAWTVVLML